MISIITICFLDTRRYIAELRNLITFIYVAELGSFTKAEEQLGYSQSTISFQIKQLEDALVSYAHQVRALTEDFKETLAKEDLKGHLHIVTPDSVCEEMISAHYADFHRKYPSIFIRFSTGDSGNLLYMLDSNEADVIITFDHHLYNKDYEVAKEQKIPMHFVASSGSKFAHRKGLSIKDIIREPFVLTEYGQGYNYF